MENLKTTFSNSTETGFKEMTAPVQTPFKDAFDLCVRKTRHNIRRLADDPKSAAFAVDGNYFDFAEGFFDIGNWTSSFFTGMALLAGRETQDEFFLQQTERLAPFYREKVFQRHADTMHDLGFLYSLYSVAIFKLTGDPSHRETGLRAAEILARRFDAKGGYIRAWGRMDERGTEYDGVAIIDCMMNLPLLYWAARETGGKKFHEIAVRHADTTLKHFVRADDSVFHAYRFDPKTGEAVGGDNYCGRLVESHWARGAAWAIYGFALSYGYTRDGKYLDAALRLAKKFIQNLDGEIVPVWDFKLPPGEKPLRDSSAAAITVCGFQELLKHLPAETALTVWKQKLLARLCTKDYLNADESCPGILKDAEIGDGIGRAKNAFTSWGDYYFMEALTRERGACENFW